MIGLLYVADRGLVAFFDEESTDDGSTLSRPGFQGDRHVCCDPLAPILRVHTSAVEPGFRWREHPCRACGDRLTIAQGDHHLGVITSQPRIEPVSYPHLT